jgi:hypothetical protein
MERRVVVATAWATVREAAVVWSVEVPSEQFNGFKFQAINHYVRGQSLHSIIPKAH